MKKMFSENNVYLVFSCIIICLCFATSIKAQAGTELLVYAIKGNITAVYNNEESPVKIGRLLKPGTVIKIKSGSKMTMVCKQGRPFFLSKEGDYPLSKWNDSCKTSTSSITANYFKYIWNEFYTHSPEYQQDQNTSALGAVTRSPAQDVFNPRKVNISFNQGLDTLNYTNGDFPLSWTCYNYSGKYTFRLYETRTGKLLYKDSVQRSFISISKFKNLLEAGKRYYWTATAPRAGKIKKRVLNYLESNKVEQFINELPNNEDIPEDSAAKYFRIGYMLEQRHFLADAYTYYKKAAETAPDITMFADKLLRFRNEFWIID